MVVSPADEIPAEKNNNMSTAPEQRSRSLHNFSSLPFFNVQWGRQKHLRCVKNSDHDSPTSSSSPNHHRRPDSLKRKSTAAVFDDDDGGIEAMREKLILEIRNEVHHMTSALLSKTDDHSAAPRPWNLRSRRAVCKEPPQTAANEDGKNGAGDRQPNLEVESVDVGPRAKFSGSLSKQEIEQDFLAILGTRPARRPKKRPRFVQKQIDALCPGYWLSEITADMYKVNENPQC